MSWLDAFDFDFLRIALTFSIPARDYFNNVEDKSTSADDPMSETKL